MAWLKVGQLAGHRSQCVIPRGCDRRRLERLRWPGPLGAGPVCVVGGEGLALGRGRRRQGTDHGPQEGRVAQDRAERLPRLGRTGVLPRRDGWRGWGRRRGDWHGSRPPD